MTIAYGCILILSVLPYVWVTLAKSGTRYDNHTPRLHTQALVGWRQRAYWAQLNAFEAMPSMAVAIIIAHLQNCPQSLIDTLSLGFVACRVLHGVFYISNHSLCRSVVWLGGFLCMIALFIRAI